MALFSRRLKLPAGLLESADFRGTFQAALSAVSKSAARRDALRCVTKGRAGTSGYSLAPAKYRTSISVGHAKTRRRRPIPQSSPVVDFQPPRCPPITPRYCRGTLLCFSWSETLEQSSGRYYYGTITTSVSKKTENLPISAMLP